MKKIHSISAFVALALLLGCLLSHRNMSRRRQGAADASDDLSSSLRLARRIETLMSEPERARPREILVSDLTREIERAAGASRIPAAALLRIEPQAPRRLGESSYREKSTRVELGRVTLPSLTRFLHRLTSEKKGLRVKDLRLKAPHGETTGDEWMAELSLSYLIYSPEKDAKP